MGYTSCNFLVASITLESLNKSQNIVIIILSADGIAFPFVERGVCDISIVLTEVSILLLLTLVPSL